MYVYIYDNVYNVIYYNVIMYNIYNVYMYILQVFDGQGYVNENMHPFVTNSNVNPALGQSRLLSNHFPTWTFTCYSTQIRFFSK